MRSRALLLLLAWPGALLARDPFQPPAEALCLRDIAPLTAWRLQGVIGNHEHFYAWLVHPQGAKMRVRPDRPFPIPPWRIVSITARELALVADKSCTPLSISFQLKGKHHDTESHRADAADRADASGARQR